MPRMNVESFNLDHRTVVAPYIRVADVKVIDGVTLTKYDIRFTQPNVDHLGTEAVHSIEHCCAGFLRNHSDAIIDFSPMGCRTGFYLLVVGEPDVEGIANLVEATFKDVLNATEVPAANEIQCGWGAHHSLEAAQKAITTMLNKRSHWLEVHA